MRRLSLLLAGIAVLAAAAPAIAETPAITGGRVVIGDGSAPIDNGPVVVRHGRSPPARCHGAGRRHHRRRARQSDDGRRRRLLANRPGRGRRGRSDQRHPRRDLAVQRRHRRGSGDQSGSLVDRDQPRRRRDSRGGVAIDRAQHFRRPGRGHRSRRRHAADHSGSRFPVHRNGRGWRPRRRRQPRFGPCRLLRNALRSA